MKAHDERRRSVKINIQRYPAEKAVTKICDYFKTKGYGKVNQTDMKLVGYCVHVNCAKA